MQLQNEAAYPGMGKEQEKGGIPGGQQLLGSRAGGPSTVPVSLQCLGDHRAVGRGPVRAANLPPAPRAEAGALHARPAPPARGAHEDHGQRGHLLHVADALHLHL